MNAQVGQVTSVSIAERYVALCDVLGFSQLIQTTPLMDVREGYREIIRDAIQASKREGEKITWPDGRKESKPATHLVGTAVFSDSIIVWSNHLSDEPEPYEGVRSSQFFLFIAHLVQRSLRRTRSGLMFPIRAGIAYGAIAILPDEHVYLGKPIVQAHKMEQAQEWVGAACHPSCLEAPDFEIVRDKSANAFCYVVDYPVPLKEDGKSEVVDPKRPDSALLALAWPGMVWTWPPTPDEYYMKTIESILEVEKARSGLTSRNVKKWENTLAFGLGFKEFRDPEDKE